MHSSCRYCTYLLLLSLLLLKGRPNVVRSLPGRILHPDYVIQFRDGSDSNQVFEVTEHGRQCARRRSELCHGKRTTWQNQKTSSNHAAAFQQVLHASPPRCCWSCQNLEGSSEDHLKLQPQLKKTQLTDAKRTRRLPPREREREL